MKRLPIGLLALSALVLSSRPGAAEPIVTYQDLNHFTPQQLMERGKETAAKAHYPTVHVDSPADLTRWDAQHKALNGLSALKPADAIINMRNFTYRNSQSELGFHNQGNAVAADQQLNGALDHANKNKNGGTAQSVWDAVQNARGNLMLKNTDPSADPFLPTYNDIDPGESQSHQELEQPQ